MVCRFSSMRRKSWRRERICINIDSLKEAGSFVPDGSTTAVTLQSKTLLLDTLPTSAQSAAA